MSFTDVMVAPGAKSLKVTGDWYEQLPLQGLPSGRKVSTL
jgi:hypothetical protein